MTDEQMQAVARCRAKIAGHQFRIDEEEGRLHDLLRDCDHLFPEGNSAVLTGLGVDTPTCKICGANNWAGVLDEHLHRYLGWPLPEPE